MLRECTVNGSPRRSIRAAIFGTGHAGQSVIRACSNDPRLTVAAGVVVDARKVGIDLGDIAGTAELGVTASADLDEVLARADIDVVFYCGIGEPRYVAGYLGRIVDAGKDAITVTGFVHPTTALGAGGASALSERAVRGGGRIVGCGLNPGFLLDVLPVSWGASCGRIRHVHALRIGEMRNWGRGIRDECGVGQWPADVASNAALSLSESAALIADGLGIAVTRVEETDGPYVTDVRRSYGSAIVEPGHSAGFHKRCVAHGSCGAIVELEWLAIFCIDPELDGVQETVRLQIAGDTTVHTEARGSFFDDPYPATAARAVSAAVALTTLPPGLYRPDQLPLSA
jgi:2,4-diaminopentanoate dehydrogenase